MAYTALLATAKLSYTAPTATKKPSYNIRPTTMGPLRIVPPTTVGPSNFANKTFPLEMIPINLDEWETKLLTPSKNKNVTAFLGS